MVPAATEGPRRFRVPLRPGDLPERQDVQGSLYDSRFEHDACGVGLVADLRARGGHGVVASALRVLRNLEHRGAKGADPDTGDGAGILTQLPDAFFRAVTGFELPEMGSYAAGIAFLPLDDGRTRACLRPGGRARRRRGADRPRLARRPGGHRRVRSRRA